MTRGSGTLTPPRAGVNPWAGLVNRFLVRGGTGIAPGPVGSARIQSRLIYSPTLPGPPRVTVPEKTSKSTLSLPGPSTRTETQTDAASVATLHSISVALWLLASIAVMVTIYFGSGLLVPLTFAVLAYLTLRPLTCRLRAFRIPPTAAAALVTLAIILAAAAVTAAVVQPAQYWIQNSQSNFATVSNKLKSIRQPMRVFERAEDQIEELTEESAGEPEEDQPVEVEVTKPGMLSKQTLMSTTMQALLFVTGVGLLTFFMLATGDDLLNRLMKSLPDFGQRRKAIEMISEIQDLVGTYLAQITMINAGLGVAVALVTWLCDMDTPLLWGVLAATLNFIPYVGALIGAALVFLAATVQFDALSSAVLVAVLYLTCTTIEGNFITPTIVGNRLNLGPVMVLISVSFWGFLWGLPGVVVAVPLLIIARLAFASYEVTEPIAVLLGAEGTDGHVDPAERPGGDKQADRQRRSTPEVVVEDDQPIAEMAGEITAKV